MLEPDSTLDQRTYEVILPNRRAAFRLHWREIRSAVGSEGSKALITYLFCLLVLISGLSVSLQTWADTKRGFAVIPLAGLIPSFDRSPEISLNLYWMMFVFALGVAGWLLTGQVTKPTCRLYVVAGMLISMLLLVTIGRNATFEQAAVTARAEARRLLQADVSTEPALTGALLNRLCTKGGLGDEDCLNAKSTLARELDVKDPSVSLGACLPGWTLSAFDQWLLAASFDRQVDALVALTSCEVGAIDPAAPSADGPTEVVVVEATTTTLADAGTSATPAVTDEVTDSSVAVEEATPAAADAPASAVPGSAAVTEALKVQRSEVMAHEAIGRGAEEVLAFASGPSQFAVFRFSGMAWLVLLAVALVWYRQLEIRAGAHRLGPIDIQFEPVGGQNEASAGGARRLPSNSAEAVFKESVIQNVPEPGAVPGSAAMAPVGDLVAQSDLPHKTLVSGVIDALQTIFATKGGFTATCSVRSTDDVHTVFVRLRDTRTGDHLASYVAQDKVPEEAARLAGYWIAGWIIRRSAYVPSWARWSEEDAVSFAKTGWVQGKEFSLSLAGATSIDLGNVGIVNSLLLVQRAYTHQIASPSGRNRFAALEDFARAAHRRPRYPVARYRRGVELGTMMLVDTSIKTALGQQKPSSPAGHDPAGATAKDTGSSRATVPVTPSRIRYLFGDLVLGSGAALDEVLRSNGADGCVSLSEGADFSTEMRWEMLKKSAQWSNENRVALKWRALARLRPSERFFWASFARGDLEKDWQRMLELARCTCAERLEVVNAERLEVVNAEPQPRPSSRDARSGAQYDRLRKIRLSVEQRAREADSHWQLSYNLACFYAIRSRRVSGGEKDACTAVALAWLERSLDRPAISQLVREWVLADDDLDPLRGIDEFKRWAVRVPPLARDQLPQSDLITEQD